MAECNNSKQNHIKVIDSAISNNVIETYNTIKNHGERNDIYKSDDYQKSKFKKNKSKQKENSASKKKLKTMLPGDRPIGGTKPKIRIMDVRTEKIDLFEQREKSASVIMEQERSSKLIDVSDSQVEQINNKLNNIQMNTDDSLQNREAFNQIPAYNNIHRIVKNYQELNRDYSSNSQRYIENCSNEDRQNEYELNKPS